MSKEAFLKARAEAVFELARENIACLRTTRYCQEIVVSDEEVEAYLQAMERGLVWWDAARDCGVRAPECSGFGQGTCRT
jgi:hypothetical protein